MLKSKEDRVSDLTVRQRTVLESDCRVAKSREAFPSSTEAGEEVLSPSRGAEEASSAYWSLASREDAPTDVICKDTTADRRRLFVLRSRSQITHLDSADKLESVAKTKGEERRSAAGHRIITQKKDMR